MRRAGLYASIFLVLITNAVVLGAVVYNRSGPPRATVTMTERELPMKYMGSDNSAVFLHLNWSMPEFHEGAPALGRKNWLDLEKLKDLGFETGFPVDKAGASRYYQRQLPRPAYIVLEYNGQAWERWKEQAQLRIQQLTLEIARESDQNRKKILTNRQNKLNRLIRTKTRLFAIDAGVEPEHLRRQYPDRSRFIVVKGLVRLFWVRGSDPKNHEAGQSFLRGQIDRIMIEEIHAPSEYRDFFQTFEKGRRYSAYYVPPNTPLEKLKPRYAVRLNYGRRLEPWIDSVKALP